MKVTKTRMAIAVALVAGTLGAVPAPAAAANANAVCIGELISFIATSSPGAVGAFASYQAHLLGGVGHVVGREASSDTCGG